MSLILLLDDPVRRSPITLYVVLLLKMAAILDFSTNRYKKTLKSAKVQNIQFPPPQKKMTRRHVTSDHSDPSLL